MSINIAIWVFVGIFAVIAVFLVRLFNQLTSVATEAEFTMRNLNSQLPRIIDKADKVLDNADATIERVNATMNDLEMPIRFVKSASGFFGASKNLARFRGGQNVMAIAAGYKFVKMILDKIRRHIGNRGDEIVE